MADYKESPSQTAGPYVHIGCMPTAAGLKGMYGGKDPGSEMITGPVNGQRITLTCRVIDGGGAPVTDAMLEIWQACPHGTFGQTAQFSNWGRGAADRETGALSFDTLKPGAVGNQAPHILVWIVARGINMGLTTRIYFEDDAALHAVDPILQLAADRADTLIARKTEDGYTHDIHLQGAQETVFFDV